MAGAQDPKSFSLGADASDSLGNQGQFIEFYQVPSMRFVKFKSFLTQYEDQFKSNWKRTPVFGKMDPIHTFQYTQRTINLGWDILAGSLPEAVENQQKLSLLIKMLYPSYEGSKGTGKRMQTAPVFKVKFMNLVTDASISGGSSTAEAGGLVCTIDGFSHSPVAESGFFTRDGALFPKNLRMSCTMHVLHTHDLGWGKDGKFDEESFPYGKNSVIQDPIGVGETRLVDGVYVTSENSGVPVVLQRNDHGGLVDGLLQRSDGSQYPRTPTSKDNE
tara:strand:- start:153 stop:974 length:822 start_codon:yes stop_codon:yes gene_type:complete